MVAGANKITVSDVLVGEVWVASGQSNMGLQLNNTTDAATTVAASADPRFREFQMKQIFSPVPLDDAAGNWVVAGPATAGTFSAVAYYFGKKIEQGVDAPVGLIHDNWGGTQIESWTSAEALASVPDLKQGAEASRQAYEGYPALVQANQAVQAWEKQYGRELSEPADISPFATGDANAADWKTIHLPCTVAAAGLPDAGAIWLRRTVTIPHNPAAGQEPLIYAPVPRSGFDEVYWNGKKFGDTQRDKELQRESRFLVASGDAVPQEGVGVLAIRLAFPLGGAVLPNTMQWGLLLSGGDWQARVEKELPPASPEAKAAFPPPLPGRPEPTSCASSLYNAMIAPLTACTIKGVIWYQGEANTPRAFQYRTSFPLMITDWRAHWNEGDFPFYFCQLPNVGRHNPMPGDAGWSELRESQARALALPNTGMAVLIDCGKEGNIHPRDKRTPGERLAAIALANTYGKQAPFAGPTFSSMAVEGDSIRVSFTHTDGGLVAKPLPADYVPTTEKPDVRVPLVRKMPNSQLEGFAICGEDHAWKWADAKIDNGTVVVRADGIAKPVAVRYAWADNPICNLSNGAGFPAAPFRTDDLPLTTQDKKF